MQKLLLGVPLLGFRLHDAGVKPVHHVAFGFRREIANTFATHTPFGTDEKFKPDGIVKNFQCKAMRSARGCVLTLDGKQVILLQRQPIQSFNTGLTALFRQLRLKVGNDFRLELVYKITTLSVPLWQLRFVSVDPARTSARRVFVIQSEHAPDQLHIAGSCLGLGPFQECNWFM